MKKIKIQKKQLMYILVIILIIIVFIYGSIISKKIKSKKFANLNMQVYENNKEQVFNVEKIIICSSANAKDLSENQNLQNLSIYQYTDVAVYIKNTEELSNKNTIKELYIDNISLEGKEDVGERSLKYKNILDFGAKPNNIEETTPASSRIDFNVIHTNEENETANYNEPTFYTDCSNPITLQYLNDNIVTNYKMDENKSVLFDGSILQETGVTSEMLQCKIKFKINIINNDNEKYTCWINFENPLEDIFQGTTMKAKTTNGNKYVFFRE